MKLEALIEKEGINNVALRTNIPHSVLNHLRAGTFDKLSKLRVFGFLSIIEKEYKVELSELRDEAKAYYEENEKQEGVLLAAEDQSAYGKGNADIYKWLMIGGAVLAIWFLISTLSKTAKDDNNTEVLSELNESNETVAPTPVEENITVTPTPVAENNITDTNLTDVNATMDANTSVADTNLTMSDSNGTVAGGSVMIKSDNAKSLWKGFLNLDTKERFNRQGSDDYTLETKGQKWVFVTGNGEINVASATTSIVPKENRGKKHYFVVENGEVKEIDRKEFLKLTHGKGLKL